MRRMQSPSTRISIGAFENGSQIQAIFIHHPQRELHEVHYGRCVAALEDKIVQRATVAVLNPIYEEDFLGFCVLQRHKERRKNRNGKRCRKAAWKMRAGPSGSAFRSGSQTTPSRFGPMAEVVSVGAKARFRIAVTQMITDFFER
jgi:hypothetical protein